MKKVTTSVITKEEFIKTMEKLERAYKVAEQTYNDLYRLLGECDNLHEITFKFFDIAIQQLSERMNDDWNSDWGGTIDWYIYDNMWGKSGYTTVINGVEYVVDDLETLWKVLTEGTD